MTTKYLKTTGINLYTINGQTYCKMMDVLKMIQHELFETDSVAMRDVLDRMEARLVKNDFILPDRKEPVKLTVPDMPEDAKEEVPGRYAVGRQKEDGWEFIAGNVGEVPLMTRKPCTAQLFAAYRDASAYADFLDEDGWQVLDWEENMTEENRWLRDLRMPFPYDMDEGMENALPVKIAGK